FAVTVHGSDTYLYMAYYDAINNEVRVRCGNIASNSTTSTNFGGFWDRETDGNGKPTAYTNSLQDVQVVAGGDNGNNRNAGSFAAIGVISKQTATVDDRVVMVWYDAVNRVLKYSYYTGDFDSLLSKKNKRTAEGWSEPVNVFTNHAGQYCQLAVDYDGGVHIAAYDSVNCDLNYAYLDSDKQGAATQNSDFVSCVVDSNGVTGSNITLDVAKVNGHWIPYIGYYSVSCIKPKLAWKCDYNKDHAGVDNNGFTKKWESTVLPTSSALQTQSNQYNNICVGLWKNNSVDAVEGVVHYGEIKSSTKGTISKRPDVQTNKAGEDYGDIYGNGTSNPILGYVVKVGASTDYIETAQMR
ncbi:MAG: hypothetical protein J6Y01_01095, partial [Spirochaetales bacterium]|nr:hypothetical protein [Spirochaetales bacterium]